MKADLFHSLFHFGFNESPHQCNPGSLLLVESGIKITTNVFPAKVYSRVNILWLEFATQTKQFQEIVSVQSQLVSFIQKQNGIEKRQWNIGFFFFENMYFCCTFSLKMKIQKILSTLSTGYFLKIAKIIPSKKNHSVQIAKIISRKTQEIANPHK